MDSSNNFHHLFDSTIRSRCGFPSENWCYLTKVSWKQYSTALFPKLKVMDLPWIGTDMKNMETVPAREAMPTCCQMSHVSTATCIGVSQSQCKNTHTRSKRLTSLESKFTTWPGAVCSDDALLSFKACDSSKIRQTHNTNRVHNTHLSIN